MSTAEIRAALDAHDADDAVQATALAAALRRVGELETAAANQPSAPTPTTRDLTDFASSSKSALDLPDGFTGAGSDLTTLRMVPGSSTKAGLVKALVTPTPNPFRVLFGGGLDSTRTKVAPRWQGFTLAGTDQGHDYNGFQVGYSLYALLEDLLITGVPGSASAPPGETFSLNLWHADYATVRDVRVDGGNVAATLLGLNGSQSMPCAGVVVEDSAFTGSRYGFGAALWQSRDVTLRRVDLSGNRRALNLENCTGWMRFEALDLRRQTATTSPHITVNSNLGSAKVEIRDPLVDKWPLRIGVSSQPYLGKPQVQKVSDVRVWVGGREVTSDPAYVMAGDVWGRSS